MMREAAILPVLGIGLACMLAGLLCGRLAAARAHRRRLALLREQIESDASLDAADVEALPSDLRDLATAVRAHRERHARHERAHDAEETENRIRTTAARLAHDIRSPLAALEAFLGNDTWNPETHVQVVRPAILRLGTIAGLLTGERLSRELLPAQGATASSARAESENQPALVSAIVEAVVSSLRLRGQPGIEDAGAVEDAIPYCLFVHVPLRAFRIAIEEIAAAMLEEASGVKGRALRFSARQEGESVLLTIEMLDRPGQKTVRSRSASPTRARSDDLMARMNDLLLPGGGSAARRSGAVAVDLTVPAASPPPWFLAELRIPAGKPLVITDDDLWVHPMWDTVLHRTSGDRPSEVLHFLSLAMLDQWLADSAHRDALGLLLLDDGYLGSDQSGLDFLERQPALLDRSVLVTGRWEDPQVRSRAVTLQVRLLPKSLVTRVPIVAGAEETRARACLPEKPDVVLVDDHVWIRKGWELAARQAGRRLVTFGSIKEFLEIQADLDRATVLFIDSDLRDEVPGEQFAWRLFDAGFTDIYLATGFDPDRFVPMPWIRGIIGKAPPDWSLLDRRDDDPLPLTAAPCGDRKDENE